MFLKKTKPSDFIHLVVDERFDGYISSYNLHEALLKSLKCRIFLEDKGLVTQLITDSWKKRTGSSLFLNLRKPFLFSEKPSFFEKAHDP
jgi:hypothetical protein